MMSEGDGDRRPWTQARRYEFAEWKLFWEGQLNRSDLERFFEISTPQASVDLRNYRDQAPGNIDYDAKTKRFVPGSAMRPLFLRPSADRLLLQLRAWLVGALPRRDLWFRNLPEIDMAPDIARHVDAECLRLILDAMRNERSIEIEYQSLTNTRWREIAPHALAFDGFRWHARAWASDHDDFRDFVLSRIQSIGGSGPAPFDPADDVEWHTRTVLRLVPHPALDVERRRAVELDYDMADGARELEVRLSMAYYYITRMNLDLVDLPPERAQVRLENLAEVEAAIADAREAAALRSGARREARTFPHG